MFEVGFWEMVLVATVALLVLGPERLPRLARETALWVRKARTMVGSVKADIDRELQLEDLRKSLPVKSGKRVDLMELSDVLDPDRVRAKAEPSTPENDRGRAQHES